jgi:hypothetical protein
MAHSVEEVSKIFDRAGLRENQINSVFLFLVVLGGADAFLLSKISGSRPLVFRWC